MSKKLFVGGLSYAIDDESLREAFAEFGEVEFVKVIRDFHSGRSKGFAFVEFKNVESANAAVLGMNGKVLDRWTITVTLI